MNNISTKIKDFLYSLAMVILVCGIAGAITAESANIYYHRYVEGAISDGIVNSVNGTVECWKDTKNKSLKAAVVIGNHAGTSKEGYCDILLGLNAGNTLQTTSNMLQITDVTGKAYLTCDMVAKNCKFGE